MRKRTKAREVALQVLYMMDMREGDEVLDNLHSILAELTDDPDVEKFARQIVSGTAERKTEIDERIVAVTEHWDMQRMATIDRNVLRIGVYEMLFHDEIPPKVAINEAIELAKRFSTEQSGIFVNGILDQILVRYRAEHPDEAQAASLEVARGDDSPKDEYDELPC